MFHCLLTIGNTRFRVRHWTRVKHLLPDPVALRTSQPCETSGGRVVATANRSLVGTHCPPFPSWPGVSRPSALRRRGADGRDTPGHDGEGCAAASADYLSQPNCGLL